ncbi:PREDICTED: histone-lysine N-methyltransferase SETMAR-like [Vollenhovia emeryi]|uniref:histone-lysine N-methyltransferase SETMAR-like n=1 Tax=Vollenhovia emeryi TaxID=411798 RepID=UPI0005F55991|nr:PREDICTED: histone-lysine N-methyltransferase SETMAR-like [Vollenhovia emeryi]
MITEDLAMRKVCAKFVPRVLSDQQKVNRVQISQEIRSCVQENPNFLDNVITGDETWCFEYDPETKRQSAEWHTNKSPRPKKARMSKSKHKSMLICFFDRRGVVHREFVPPGQTVNASFYVDVLDRLRKRVLRVRPDMADSWKLHHDNAPCHTALLRDLKGNRYNSVEDVQEAVTASLKGIPESEFQKAYAQWESRYMRCVEAQGCYFEDY